MPNPIDDPDLYTGIWLAGVKSPGQVTITGLERKVNWDIKTAPGQAGATTTLKDIPPAEFTCAFYLVRDDAQGIDDFEDWPDFQRLIDSTVADAKPKALDIYHPDLAALDIKSVVKASISGVTHDGKGGQTISVKFLEYKPPKKKGGSPSGSKSTKKTPDPDQAALDELKKLTDEYKKTPWG